MCALQEDHGILRTMLERYADPGGNEAKEWRSNFWPKDDWWEGFEDKLNKISRDEMFPDNQLFRFMVNDLRTMIENGCNFGAALSVLCFSEACGQLYATEVLGEQWLKDFREKRKKEGEKRLEPTKADYFRLFLEDCMEYSVPFPERLYGEVRCALAHSYFLKEAPANLFVTIGGPGNDPQNILSDNGVDIFHTKDSESWVISCMDFFRRFLFGIETLYNKSPPLCAET